MDIEELEPRKRKSFEIGEDLSDYSVEELKELAATLKIELERIDNMLKSKEYSRHAADSAFKS